MDKRKRTFVVKAILLGCTVLICLLFLDAYVQRMKAAELIRFSDQQHRELERCAAQTTQTQSQLEKARLELEQAQQQIEKLKRK